ncbi:MAG: hypothetical protein IJO62_03210 [Clostridia bacterium]|nr:hypothetical protein [Clostridia bacterium]
MADKKVSDTISQQQKSRQEFLELKRMQKGEIAPEPKPSEIAIVPKTFKEKLQNYWFHFKWHTITTVLCIAVFIFCVCECSAKPNWDMQVVYFSYTSVLDNQIEAVSNYLEGFAEDINGDGEININVVNCSVSEDDINSPYSRNILTKLQSMLFAEHTAILYITDEKSITYFENDKLKNFFYTDQLKFGDDFYAATKNEQLGELPEGLQIAARKVEGTAFENNKTAEKIQGHALKLLEKLKGKT